MLTQSKKFSVIRCRSHDGNPEWALLEHLPGKEESQVLISANEKNFNRGIGAIYGLSCFERAEIRDCFQYQVKELNKILKK